MALRQRRVLGVSNIFRMSQYIASIVSAHNIIHNVDVKKTRFMNVLCDEIQFGSFTLIPAWISNTMPL